MENSKVFNALVVLNKWERRGLDKFVQSVYFNHQEEVSILYKILNECIDKDIPFPDKEAIYKKLHPRQAYNDQQFRLYMSYLFKTIEKFLIIEQIEDDPFLQKLKLMSAYNQHNHHKNFHKTYEDAAKLLEEFPYKNAYYYESYYNIETERYNEKRNLSRTSEYNFQLLTTNFDIYFIAEKLKQGCILVSHEQVHQIKYDYGMFDIVIKHVEDKNLLDTPAIAIYYYIYQIIQFSDKQENFDQLLVLINKYLKLFPKIEARDILIYANNYCIKMNNMGKEGYARKSFDINKIGIESGAFLEKGFLSRFTYKNIVTVGIRLQEYKWTEKFIEQYKGLLEEKYQESTYCYNKAFLEYERKNYSAAIKLLQKADYDDLLLNLAAKNILMKIYYELEYIEPLEYLLGSVLTLLKRKKLEQVYKNNYINIAKLTKRLISLKTLTMSQRKHLEKRKDITRKIIEETNPCFEKKWLLEHLEMIK
ncbi:MAG: hypothetical protein JWN78_575 [Bacteroidota bacterium]|nr:hypothetical protein [Bacteroidota bacterium]